MSKRRYKRSKRSKRRVKKTPGKLPWRWGWWTGPGWSAGEHQESVRYRPGIDPEPVDKLDAAAAEHDTTYAIVSDKYKRARKRLRFDDPELIKADEKFAKKARKSGTAYGFIDAALVGLQGKMRSAVRWFTKSKALPDLDDQQMSSTRFSHFTPDVVRTRESKSSAIRGQKEHGFGISTSTSCAIGFNSIPIAIPTGTGGERFRQEDSIYYAIGLAMLRRIMKKEFNVYFTTETQTIASLVPHHTYRANPGDTSAGHNTRWASLNFHFKSFKETATDGYVDITNIDGSGNTPTPAEIIIPNDTVTTIGDLALQIANCLYTMCMLPWTHTTAGVPYQGTLYRELYGYAVTTFNYASSTGIGPNAPIYNMLSSPIRRCDNWILKLDYNTQVKVMNRGYVSDDLQLPIRLKMLKFSGNLPRIRMHVMATGTDNVTTITPGGNQWLVNALTTDDVTKLIFDPNGDGFHIPTHTRVGGLMTHPFLNQILRADQFENCIGTKTMTLHPNEITSCTIPFHFEGYLTTLLRIIRVQIESSATAGGKGQIDKFTDSIGNFYAFSAEHVMNFNFGNTTTEPETATGSLFALAFAVKRSVSAEITKEVHNNNFRLMRNYADPVKLAPSDAMGGADGTGN